MDEPFLGVGPDFTDRPLPEGLNGGDLLSLFRAMVYLRAFDERAVALQRQGRLGNYPMCWGEEATQAGPLRACGATDWVFPSYRQQAVGILRGIDPATIFRYRRGVGGKEGFWSPRRYRVAPIAISVATHLPHAVGFAWAARARGERTCALAWFGDGATSEGDFHEALNFAAVFRAPVVFFCTNNQWAISTPFSRQTASETVAQKALAYGIEAARIDGFDVVACWKATSDALERARAGGGPTLIEAVTYRLGPHATADDPSRYRDESETEPWRRREPIGRVADYLVRHGISRLTELEAMAQEARERISAAVEEMEASGRPDPSVLFETTYAGVSPQSFAESLAEVRGDVAGSRSS